MTSEQNKPVETPVEKVVPKPTYAQHAGGATKATPAAESITKSEPKSEKTTEPASVATSPSASSNVPSSLPNTPATGPHHNKPYHHHNNNNNHNYHHNQQYSNQYQQQYQYPQQYQGHNPKFVPQTQFNPNMGYTPNQGYDYAQKNKGGNRMNKSNVNRHHNNYDKNYRNMNMNPAYAQAPMMMAPPYMHVPGQTPMYPIDKAPVTPAVKKHVPLTIKNKDGTEVKFPTHGKSSSISANAPVTTDSKSTQPAVISSTTTTTTTATESKSTDSNSSSTAPAQPKKDSKSAFQLQFLEQLKKKKMANSANKPVAEPTPEIVKPKEEAKEEVKEEVKESDEVKEEVEPVEKSIEATKVEEVEKEEVTESNDEVKPAVNEEVTATKENAEEEKPSEEKPSEEKPSEEKPSEEKPSEEKEAETETETETEVKAETKESTPEESTEQEVQEEAAPVAEESKHISMSKFFELIKQATPIDDPFTFKYSENVTGPNENCASKSVRRYDPGFLLQFDKLNYSIDDDFKTSFLSKIYIPERSESRDKSFRNKDSRSRSNGPLRGMALRGEFEGRTNSRTGSKRKGRDGREKSKRGDKEGSRRSRGNRGDKPAEKADEKPQIKLAPEDVKPLEKTANRWVPKSQKEVTKEVKYAPDGVTVIYDDEDLSKKIRSLLNKLSLEKFDNITDELVALANQSQWETNANALKMAVKLTFAKATDEPHWSAMYASFCQKLVTKTNPEVYSTDMPVPGDEGKFYKGTQVTYRLLVLRCQTEYEKGWSTDLPVNEDGTPLEPELMSDEYYELAAQKRRGLGLVRFIGELYRLNLIKINVIISCIAKLTSDKDAAAGSDENYLPQEDTLETLNQFLLTVGEKLQVENPKLMAFAFSKITTYITNPAIGSRIKYKFLDLMDLQKAGWKNASTKLGGPKTLSQIHAEFNSKNAENERERNARSRSNRSNSKWGNDKISSNDISKVGLVRKSGESSISALRKGKSSVSMVNDFTTVSSRSRSSRGTAPPISRSASTSSTANPEDQGELRQQSNNFNLLMGDDDDSDEEKEETEDHKEEDDDEEEAEHEEEEHDENSQGQTEEAEEHENSADN